VPAAARQPLVTAFTYLMNGSFTSDGATPAPCRQGRSGGIAGLTTLSFLKRKSSRLQGAAADRVTALLIAGAQRRQNH